MKKPNDMVLELFECHLNDVDGELASHFKRPRRSISLHSTTHLVNASESNRCRHARKGMSPGNLLRITYEQSHRQYSSRAGLQG